MVKFKSSQADFKLQFKTTTAQASNLKRHFKTHGGEKSNKCKQSDSAFFCDERFEKTSKEAQWEQWEKNKQMHPV